MSSFYVKLEKSKLEKKDLLSILEEEGHQHKHPSNTSQF